MNNTIDYEKKKKLSSNRQNLHAEKWDPVPEAQVPWDSRDPRTLWNTQDPFQPPRLFGDPQNSLGARKSPWDHRYSSDVIREKDFSGIIIIIFLYLYFSIR